MTEKRDILNPHPQTFPELNDIVFSLDITVELTETIIILHIDAVTYM